VDVFAFYGQLLLLKPACFVVGSSAVNGSERRVDSNGLQICLEVGGVEDLLKSPCLKLISQFRKKNCPARNK